jgi:hypothetical protein
MHVLHVHLPSLVNQNRLARVTRSTLPIPRRIPSRLVSVLGQVNHLKDLTCLRLGRGGFLCRS